MKTTKRSKMLLSSIAMLLVALVALGSATYAWYVVNKTVTAEPISITAAAADGLVGAKNSTDTTWSNSVTLSGSATLYPASIAPTAKTGMSSATGTSLSNGSYSSAGSGFTITPGSATSNLDTVSTDAYVADDFYIKSTGSALTNKVKIKITGTTTDASKAYLNCLVFVNGSYFGGSCIDGSATNASAVARKNDGTTETYKLTKLGDDLGTIPSVTGTPIHVEVIVYADGENTKCTNNSVYTQPGQFTVTCYYE